MLNSHFDFFALFAGVGTHYCLWTAAGHDLVLEVEVIDVEVNEQNVEEQDMKGEESEWGTKGLNDGGRQENSLRTVPLNSQVLYTNTGWSVRRFRAGI